MFINTLLDKSKSRQETELALFCDGITGITVGVRADRYSAFLIRHTPAAACSHSKAAASRDARDLQPAFVAPPTIPLAALRVYSRQL